MENVEENEDKWKGKEQNKQKWKKGRRKMKENEKFEGKKDWKKAEDLFFFCFSLFGIHWNFFGVYKIGNFYREKANITLGKNQEKWLSPPAKIFLLRPCKLLISPRKTKFQVFLPAVIWVPDIIPALPEGSSDTPVGNNINKQLCHIDCSHGKMLIVRMVNFQSSL